MVDVGGGRDRLNAGRCRWWQMQVVVVDVGGGRDRLNAGRDFKFIVCESRDIKYFNLPPWLVRLTSKFETTGYNRGTRPH